MESKADKITRQIAQAIGYFCMMVAIYHFYDWYGVLFATGFIAWLPMKCFK